jgi:hypothetical protein
MANDTSKEMTAEQLAEVIAKDFRDAQDAMVVRLNDPRCSRLNMLDHLELIIRSMRANPETDCYDKMTVDFVTGEVMLDGKFPEVILRFVGTLAQQTVEVNTPSEEDPDGK